MGDQSHLQIIFVGPNGETTEGPLIALDASPHEELPRYADEKWDSRQCISEFRNAIEGRPGSQLHWEACVRALDRLDCWTEAMEQFLRIPGPNETLGHDLLHCWIQWGFHMGPSLKGSTVVIDLLKHLMPSYTGAGRKLYRGELQSRYEQRKIDFSWTPFIRTARMFANRRMPLGEGLGVVLEIDAIPEMIISDLAARTASSPAAESELEYVLDPRLLKDVRVVAQEE